MKQEEFVRCTPEEVGVRSADVLVFLDAMNDGHTEMHSLMIMRHEKILAEGWWNPYSAGMRHTMMSTTKTFTGTAVGIAVKEGILSLDDRIVDLLEEFVPENPSEYLQEITIRHLLTMSSGMETACTVDENYVSNFMNTPVVHKPGTAFFYNDSAVTLLPYIVYRKTGEQMVDYLKERLFDKIGIDVRNVHWFPIATGTAFGAGGFFCKTEDALRLMLLYRRGGKWNGEEILTEDYVAQATGKQIDTDLEYLPKDNRNGYGYLMWMGSKPGTYRSEGAYGQITTVDPETDTIISFTEANHSFDPASQDSMDRVWDFLEGVKDETLGYNPLSKAVKERFATLSVIRDPYNPYGEVIEDVTYQGKKGAHIEELFYQQVKSNPASKSITGLTEFSIHKADPMLYILSGVINGRKHDVCIPLDGSRYLQVIDEFYKSRVYVSGYFNKAGNLCVRFRWIETVFVKELEFHFDEDRCLVTERLCNDSAAKPITYVFEKCA